MNSKVTDLQREVRRAPAAQELCFLSPYVEAIRLLGNTADEDVLFAASSGPAFAYGYVHQGARSAYAVSPEDWISIEGARPVVLSALEDFGIGIEVQAISDNDPVSNELLAWLRQGGVAIVYADVYDLPYHPFHRELHGQTSLILHAVDEGAATAAFVDTYVKTLKVERMEGWIALTDLSRAMAGDKLHMRQIELCRPSVPHSPAVWSNVLACAEQFLRPSDDRSGVAGMSALHADLGAWPALWKGDAMARNARMAYHHATGRGGPCKTRLAFARFLMKWPAFGGRSNKELASGFGDAGRLWTSLAATFFRCSMTPTEALLAKARDQLATTAACERQVFGDLAALLRNERTQSD